MLQRQLLRLSSRAIGIGGGCALDPLWSGFVQRPVGSLAMGVPAAVLYVKESVLSIVEWTLLGKSDWEADYGRCSSLEYATIDCSIARWSSRVIHCFFRIGRTELTARGILRAFM